MAATRDSREEALNLAITLLTTDRGNYEPMLDSLFDCCNFKNDHPNDFTKMARSRVVMDIRHEAARS